jgi:outer membrane protein assembly factor BamA
LPTTITPAVSFSFKKNLTASLGIDHYFGQDWHFTNQTILQQNGRSYYLGLGDRVSRDVKTLYKNNAFFAEGEFTARLGGHFLGGIRYHFRHDSPLEFDRGAQPLPPAQSGWLTGVGPLLRFDSRDDALYPGTGYLIQVSAIHYGNYLGGKYIYNDVRADYRLYQKFGSGVLAWRAFFQGTFNGNAPFYQLPYISADHVLRGLWRNQYIDRQSLSAETEFRGDFSKVDKRFGYLLFAGAGDVAENFFRDYNPKVTGVFGAGFRQQLMPKSNLQSHLEVSFTTRGDVGVFGGVGLAF